MRSQTLKRRAHVFILVQHDDAALVAHVVTAVRRHDTTSDTWRQRRDRHAADAEGATVERRKLVVVMMRWVLLAASSALLASGGQRRCVCKKFIKDIFS